MGTLSCTLFLLKNEKKLYSQFTFAPICYILCIRGQLMFDQQEYINKYIKDNYKSFKIRIKKDDKLLINKISEVDNINQYITSLIRNDIYKNREYHFIDNEIQIDFELSKVMQNLVDEAEMADILNDYGLYMNLADAIDSQAKKETTHHLLRESEWKQLIRRYRL